MPDRSEGARVSETDCLRVCGVARKRTIDGEVMEGEMRAGRLRAGAWGVRGSVMREAEGAAGEVEGRGRGGVVRVLL